MRKFLKIYLLWKDWLDFETILDNVHLVTFFKKCAQNFDSSRNMALISQRCSLCDEPTRVAQWWACLTHGGSEFDTWLRQTFFLSYKHCLQNFYLSGNMIDFTEMFFVWWAHPNGSVASMSDSWSGDSVRSTPGWGKISLQRNFASYFWSVWEK